MKRLRVLIFAIVAATTVAAQTSLSLWPYYVELTPQRNSTGMYETVVPLPVLDKARTDLADLRLYDSSNREIPYAIRVLREVDEQKEMPVRMFNSATTGSASEVSVDLLGDNHGEHNEIEIQTDGDNFRRQVVIEGSDTGSDWRTLKNDGVIFSFSSQNSSVDSGRITYPTSRYRYLRVRVMRDPVADRDVPRVSNVKVMMAVREKGSLSTWEVAVPSYQLLRNQGAHASAWTIDLGGRAPCDRLTLYIAEDSFSRPFQVESIDDPEDARLLATGTLTRHAGEEKQPLVITLNQEENVRKLRLQITDYSNPTLSIAAIYASAPARQLIFEMKTPPEQPLRLFFGNANVPAPHYDFEKELPLRLSGDFIHATIGDVANNGEYKPEPLPFTERVPWLIYLVLAASSIALGFILFSLARTATQFHAKAQR
jgi:uncharacterized protein DUF3999